MSTQPQTCAIGVLTNRRNAPKSPTPRQRRRAVLNLGHFDFDIVSDFGIRISDFSLSNPLSAPDSPSWHLYTCREASTNRTFCAKQTQSPKQRNHRNLLYHKDLPQYPAPLPPKKQTQSNPIHHGEAGSNPIPGRSENIQYQASRIEHPVSRTNHLAKNSGMFCAKQTQSPKPQNPRNPLWHTDLHQYSAPRDSKKQTQSNPIPPKDKRVAKRAPNCVW